ncbi:uncharacterized protein LOC143742509 [Siphateles boraxobius]|uniref:uncharacterized protein LOC143742509 n=1 Tax=Siphateles boraxobius TaxID=180520 RepID=UPI004063F38A
MLTSHHAIWPTDDFTCEPPQEPTRSWFPETPLCGNRAQKSTELITSPKSPIQPPEGCQRSPQTPTPEVIVSLIREMLTKQEMILDQQQSILRILNAKQLQDTNSKIEDGLLPVKDFESLKRLEQKLLSPDLKENLINNLGLVGGFDVKDTVWRIMRRTISNELAKIINWKGVNGKISLAALHLKDVVIAAVRKNPLTASAAEMEVEGTMKRWLQLAADRDGGRKRRLLQKEVVHRECV